MSVKFKYLLLGFLFGVFVSGIAWYSTILGRASYNNLSLTSYPSTSPSETSTKPSDLIEKEGRININQATIEDLMTLPGIGEAKALAIISFRDKYGLFEKLDELLYIGGISENLFHSIEPFLYIEGKE